MLPKLQDNRVQSEGLIAPPGGSTRLKEAQEYEGEHQRAVPQREVASFIILLR